MLPPSVTTKFVDTHATRFVRNAMQRRRAHFSCEFGEVQGLYKVAAKAPVRRQERQRRGGRARRREGMEHHNMRQQENAMFAMLRRCLRSGMSRKVVPTVCAQKGKAGRNT